MMTRDDLLARLDAIPRVPLAHLPTPLDPAPRLSAALGGPEIWIKRDDLTGLAFGGNKTRQLEYLFAEIQAQGCDTVVGGAYTQSNWCRQMTAAAKKLGLDIHLVLLHGEKGPKLQGNFLLYKLMGAEIDVVALDSMEEVQPLLEAKAETLRKMGRKPFVVGPMQTESLVTSALGYVRAAAELDRQLDELGLAPGHLYLSGANMTPAGLALGLKALARKMTLHNIAPIQWSTDRAWDIARIATATAGRLGLDLTVDAAEIDSSDAYIGPRYGVVTDAAREALALTARTEGIILDPVYSAKAMAGLIDHVRRGSLTKGEQVVFLHTGGTPALFAYAEDVLAEAGPAAAPFSRA
jgi:D-cysteine desulfhydrase family pyridoxal phosphate-dependent enzyme